MFLKTNEGCCLQKVSEITWNFLLFTPCIYLLLIGHSVELFLKLCDDFPWIPHTINYWCTTRILFFCLVSTRLQASASLCKPLQAIDMFVVCTQIQHGINFGMIHSHRPKYTNLFKWWKQEWSIVIGLNIRICSSGENIVLPTHYSSDIELPSS